MRMISLRAVKIIRVANVTENVQRKLKSYRAIEGHND